MNNNQLAIVSACSKSWSMAEGGDKEREKKKN